MSSKARPEIVPFGVDDAVVRAGDRDVRLTNLRKPFFPQIGATKGDVLRYYAAVAHALLPHVASRAMVMKRYPGGAEGAFFFMKRVPPGRPAWLTTCPIDHGHGKGVIDFPVVDDLASLLWIVNLGCIDLNPWYARCDDVSRPDVLHFDLDPVKAGAGGPTPFSIVREAALEVRTALEHLGLRPYAKTSGAHGMHVYVPIVRGPLQHEVWRFAKAFALTLAKTRPDILTAEYVVAKRPSGRVLIDYNQNAFGRTLASVYSLRPMPRASASAPVTWAEIEGGIEIEDFRIDNLPARLARAGDLWKPVSAKTGRCDLTRYLGA